MSYLFFGFIIWKFLEMMKIQDFFCILFSYYIRNQMFYSRSILSFKQIIIYSRFYNTWECFLRNRISFMKDRLMFNSDSLLNKFICFFLRDCSFSN